MADSGLLADGATLWFSVIVGYETGANNTRLGFALANSSFNTGNFKYWINNEGAQLGTGVGFSLSGNGNGVVNASHFRDLSAGDTVAGIVNGPTSGTIVSNGNPPRVLAGSIAWGATSDVITIYAPNTSLALGTAISTLTVNVDQSTFDTITWARGDKIMMDEIRFGATSGDVLPLDTVAPTLLSITDNMAGGPIGEDVAEVTYTLTFDRPMDLTTFNNLDDFDTVGTASSGTTIGATITQPSPNVINVKALPTTLGDVQLRIPTTAVIKSLAQVDLDNDPALLDDTTITIAAGLTPPGTPSSNRWWDGATITGITNGVSAGGTGTWSTTNTNWDRGAGFEGPVAWDNAASPSLNAILSGAENAVRTATMSETINIKDLTFDTTGATGTRYTIAGGTLNFAPGAVIRANDNRYDQTITSVITGSPAVQTRDNGATNTYKGLIFAPASGTQTIGAVLNPNNTGATDKAGVTFGGSTTGNTIASISYAGGDLYADTNFTGGGWTVSGTVTTGSLRISGGRAIINGNTTTMYNGLVMSGTGVLGGSTTIFKDDRRASNNFVSGTGIAPGNGVGTLTFDWGINGTPIAGQWTTAFRAGSNYEWQVGASATDVVHVVDGIFIVEGFTLKIIDAGGAPANGAVQLPVFTYGTLNTKTLDLAAVVANINTSDLVGKGWTIGTLALTDNGSGTIYLTGLSKGGSPYATWATGSEPFDGDANGDGVKDGLAWFLGVATPATNALNKLPVPDNDGSFLTLDFQRVNPYSPAKLYVQFGNNLSGWTEYEIPLASSLDIGGGVQVVVSGPGAPTPDTVTVKIPTTYESASGALFARLRAENP